jgi:gamma-glutamylcyclotransferase (GGCT)/AIG2-like uncharacterized protein YtfP
MESTVTESRYLFVYGSLRRAAGTEWSRFLTSASRFAGPGRTRGALFQLDGHPGMVAGEHQRGWVNGEVCLLNESSSALAVLDAYEGCGPGDRQPHSFERQVVDVIMDDGKTIRAWAYVYCLDTAGRARILSGDYLLPKQSQA